MQYRPEELSLDHHRQPVLQAGQPPDECEGAVVLVHGRGASGEGMINLARHLNTTGLALRALQADSHTWYPNSFLAPRDKNEPGIRNGLKAIDQVVKQLLAGGLSSREILLLGFSQGACLALDFAAQYPGQVGAVAALSGGLIGAVLDPGRYASDMAGLNVFMGCSTDDPHIPEERVRESARLLEERGARVNQVLYPGMGHTVNEAELQTVDEMLDELRG